MRTWEDQVRNRRVEETPLCGRPNPAAPICFPDSASQARGRAAPLRCRRPASAREAERAAPPRCPAHGAPPAPRGSRAQSVATHGSRPISMSRYAFSRSMSPAAADRPSPAKPDASRSVVSASAGKAAPAWHAHSCTPYGDFFRAVAGHQALRKRPQLRRFLPAAVNRKSAAGGECASGPAGSAARAALPQAAPACGTARPRGRESAPPL